MYVKVFNIEYVCFDLKTFLLNNLNSKNRICFKKKYKYYYNKIRFIKSKNKQN